MTNKLSIITGQYHCYQYVENIWKNNLQFFIWICWRRLLSAHQSGFLSNDSSVNQLLSIVHNLYKAFDAYPTLETRGVFIDMSKAFDKVWHQGLIFKLKSIGVSDTLLSLIESFLSNRFQNVVKWSDIRIVSCQGWSRLVPWSAFFPNLH